MDEDLLLAQLHVNPFDVEADLNEPIIETPSVDVNIDTSGLAEGFQKFYKGYQIVTTVLIVILVLVFIYVLIKLRDVRRKQHEKLLAGLKTKDESSGGRNERWERVTEMFQSENPADWRIGIIEADSMLEDLVIRLGYEGESLGERMKQIDRGDFPAIDFAWEAHLVRNKIAHQGLDYKLTQNEAIRVLQLYQRVFQDAGYI